MKSISIPKKDYPEYLKNAARAVREQLEDYPQIGISVDKDVAEYMGAFEEKAISLDEAEEIEVIDYDL